MTDSVITEDSSNIGIGDATPTSKLSVVGTGSSFTTGDGTRAFRVFTDSDEVSLLADGTVDMKFYTSGSEKMRITTAGAIKLSNYGAGTLVSDASGNITSISGGGEGGPYLPLAGGTLTGNLLFGDNVQARFGASDDLQIYHDAGGDSYIKELGTGQFYIQAENFRFKSSDGASTLITANVGGAVSLYYDNSKKFETTSSGVSVTGGILLPNNNDIGWDGGYSAGKPTLAAVGTTMKMFPSGSVSGEQFTLTPTAATFGGEVEVINANGLITGRSSSSSNTNSSLRFMGGAYTGNKATAILYDGVNGENQLYLGGGTSLGEPATNIRFHTGSAGATGAGTERMRIDSGGDLTVMSSYAGGTFPFRVGFGTYASYTPTFVINDSGNCGIGTANPNSLLHIYDASGGATLKVESNTSNAYDSSKIQLLGGNLSTSEILLGDSSDSDVGRIIYRHDGNSLSFDVNATEAMRIDSSGQVGIGVTPTVKFQVAGSSKLGGALYVSSDENYNTSATYTFRDAVFINNPNDTSATSSGNTVMSIGGMSGNSVKTSLITTGAIGIGTSVPEKKLHIFDSTQTNQTIRFGNPSATPLADINYNSSGNEFLTISCKGTTTGFGNIVFETGPTPTEAMRIDSSGLVGIGISPTAPLHVSGTIQSVTGATTIQMYGTGGSRSHFSIRCLSINILN